ncbi:MAG: iron uptake porin [Cyanobacteria bacterium J06631_2]
MKVAPVLLLAFSNPQSATANDEMLEDNLQQIRDYQQLNQGLSQVTNVNQLRDVSPTDWSYEALRSLVDRYGCISGFPNQTYRGNQPLSRYEFAAGLNSCLNQIERLIASGAGTGTEDIETVQRLAQEFEAELATFDGRIGEIESRTAIIEDSQFSTTTKLNGEVIFAIADTFGDVDGEDPSETTFSDRVRLNFDSSLYGKDRLRVRLQAGNTPEFDEVTGFDSTRLGFEATGGNNIDIEDLYYRFPLANGKIRGFAGTAGMGTHDFLGVVNPILASSGSGALSRFNRRNPITHRGIEGTGFGVEVKAGEKLTFKGLYLSDSGVSSPEEGEGLFNGSFSAGGQIAFTPNDNLDLALTYIYEFQTEDDVDLTGDTASNLAQTPFGEVDTRVNQVGLEAAYSLGDKLVFSGFGGGSFADEVTGEGNATLYTASITASLLDIGREGAAFSVAAGIPPRLVENEGGEEDDDTIYLIEALYKFPVNDNILLTPGAYVVINPEGTSDNDTQVVGVLRTTFKF